jgi:hypothetical protein
LRLNATSNAFAISIPNTISSQNYDAKITIILHSATIRGADLNDFRQINDKGATCFKLISYLCRRRLREQKNEVDMEQRTMLNEAQLSILRLLGRMKTLEQVNELRQVISNYYAQKATEEMDRLWDAGQWSEQENEAVLKEHLRTPYKYVK